ncbi:hypothetical protein OG978_43330 (plasmid) [Streptomyces sp. NBC_01591]|uniref:hypothetical protein n=1 Tax=Streptomyces sp. NBC_01591 TaxID=2975888 RepID=UPI002DD9D3DF|nr:hypothetical protein [Streptomyces sp. NBC_01591]WSD74005.1 hypothetical protein OG978_43330 [Streptomyces sp. NBC_01591]
MHLVDGVALPRPEEQVFAAMLTGFANRQLARNPARTTVEGRESTVKAFSAYVNTYPWHRTLAMVDEWLGDLRSLRDLKRSTIRSYWPCEPSATSSQIRSTSGRRPAKSGSVPTRQSLLPRVLLIPWR